MTRRFSIAAVVMTIAVMAPGNVSTHVSLEQKQATVGAPYKAVFRVPHGCSGSATKKVIVQIPEGVIGVKPMPKPGWTLTIERGPYQKSYKFYHGNKLSEGVRTVAWTGGPLADEHYDEFVLSSFVAGELPADTPIYFPVTQECEKGELKWVEIPASGQDPHDLEAPAPVLKLVRSEGGHGGHGHAANTSETKVGNLVINKPWSRTTPPGASVGVGYLEIRNTGDAPDTLLGAAANFAKRVEVHESSEKDGIATMRKLADGLELPANETVELKPGGFHLMLMGLHEPITTDKKLPIELHFKNAGKVTVEFDVTPIGAAKSDSGHKHHH